MSPAENRPFLFVPPDITVNLFINLTVFVTRFFVGRLIADRRVFRCDAMKGL